MHMILPYSAKTQARDHVCLCQKTWPEYHCMYVYVLYVCITECMCMYASLQVCVYVCIIACMCMYAALHVCVCMHHCMYVYVCIIACMCMYASLHVCVYVCITACMCICMHHCMYVYVCTIECMCVCMHHCMYVYVCMCMFASLHVCVCMHHCMYAYVQRMRHVTSLARRNNNNANNIPKMCLTCRRQEDKLSNKCPNNITRNAEQM
jgi:hypothetical protein